MLNQKADYYREIIDFHDWCVSNAYFRERDSLWGSLHIDCFASYANTLGVNALHSWKGENCWLVPPVCLVSPQVIEDV